MDDIYYNSLQNLQALWAQREEQWNNKPVNILLYYWKIFYNYKYIFLKKHTVLELVGKVGKIS